MFWQDVMKGKEFAKQSIELQEECDLSGDCIRRYLNKMAEQGLIIFRKKKYNNAPTYHFTIQNSLILDKIRILQNTNLAKYQNGNLPISENTSFKTGTLQETMETGKTPISITEEDNKKTTEEKPSTEINSAPQLFKSELMQQELENAIGKNETAKPKTKKLKAELSEQDKQIAETIKEVADRFKKWYLGHKKIVYPYKRHDFINLTTMFKDLCNNNGYTPEMVVADISKIVNGYSKLSTFNQNNFSLNLIATKYNVLLSEIDSYKPPVAKQNFNEPVPYVHKRLPQYYDGYALPLGITAMQFEQLAELVMRERIMEGLIDENLRLSGFCQMYRIELHKITEEQLTQLMKDYEII